MSLTTNELRLGRRGLSIAGSSVFDPLSLSPAGWWEADAITGLNDGDPVASWVDSSGNSRPLLQAVGFAQPLYKTNIVNGLPVLRFDGTDDRIFAQFTLDQPTHLFVVGKWRNAYAANDTLVDGAGFQYSALIARTSSTTVAIYSGGAAVDLTTTPGSFHAYSAVFSGASSELRADGGTAVSGSAGTTNPGGVCVGAVTTGADPGAVDVAAVGAFSSVLSAGNRQSVESYLATKYAL